MRPPTSRSRRLRAQWVAVCLGIPLVGVHVSMILARTADLPNNKPAPHPIPIEKQVALANDYLFGRGVPRDTAKAAYLLEQAARAGDPQAQLELGYFYESGIGVSKDAASAAKWYRLSASSGLAEAKANLAILYFWGLGVAEDRAMAIQLFREAAQKGSAAAEYALGDLYVRGVGVLKDRATAEKWLSKSAKLHYPKAEYQLALLMLSDINVKAHLRKAVSLLRSSAAEGYVPAMYSLGISLIQYPETAKDPGEGIRFLDQSANGGIWKASETLGLLTRDGNALPKDDKAAYLHLRIATLQGGAEAQRVLAAELERLSTTLSLDQLTALDSEAAEWYHRHPSTLEFLSTGKDGKFGDSSFALAMPKDGTHELQLLSAPQDGQSPALELSTVPGETKDEELKCPSGSG